MLKIIPVVHPEQFEQAWRLITEMARWDAEESERLGLNGQEVVAFFYPSDAASLQSENVPPEGCLLLATFEDEPVGCAAFRRLDVEACELHHLYVLHEFRGRGIARRMLEQLLRTASSAGYEMMRLETTPFMKEAQALYKSLGFQSRGPYRPVPEAYQPFTVVMERSLPD